MFRVAFVELESGHWHEFLSWYQHVTAWVLTSLTVQRDRTELQNENQYSSEYQGDMA